MPAPVPRSAPSAVTLTRAPAAGAPSAPLIRTRISPGNGAASTPRPAATSTCSSPCVVPGTAASPIAIGAGSPSGSTTSISTTCPRATRTASGAFSPPGARSSASPIPSAPVAPRHASSGAPPDVAVTSSPSTGAASSTPSSRRAPSIRSASASPPSTGRPQSFTPTAIRCAPGPRIAAAASPIAPAGSTYVAMRSRADMGLSISAPFASPPFLR